MSRLPRYPADARITGEDLNHILTILDSGLGNKEQVVNSLSGATLNPTITNPGGSANPGQDGISALTPPRGLTGSYGIDNFSQTHTAFVLLSWTPNPLTDFVSRYDIYYHRGSEPTVYTQSVGGGITSTRINNLFPGNAYSFAVQAHDAANRSSPWCPEINITISLDSSPPAVPTGLTAVAFVKAVFVTWAEVGPEGLSNDLKQYQIQSDTNSAFNVAPVLSTVGPGNSFYYPYATSATTLYFRIRSADWTGNLSDWSGTVSAVTG
jgi:hypothetical protein